jgi:transposase InsO family protein
MPWKTASKKELRWNLVREMEREQLSVSELCRRYGVSRKTGYKWKARYHGGGRSNLTDRPPVARRIKSGFQGWERKQLRALHRRHGSWGPKKIHALMRVRSGAGAKASLSTVKRWFVRWGWVKPKRGRRLRPCEVLRREGPRVTRRPNEVWTVDFKGWFRTGSGIRVEPLTVRDLHSRYVVAIELLADQKVSTTRAAMERVFRQHGLPECLRSDNGGPFGSTGCLGLTRLSAWWVRLGIGVEFTDPGHPEQNGAHEQMHRMLKADTANPPAHSLRAQKARSAKWRREYNELRPHEGIGLQVPVRGYRISRRRLPEVLPEVAYPKGWRTRWVKGSGEMCLEGIRCFVGEAFAGQRVALEPVAKGVVRVHFAGQLLGEIWPGDRRSIRPRVYDRGHRRIKRAG